MYCHMAYYEIGLIVVTLPILFFFGYLIYASEPFDAKVIIAKFTSALALFWAYMGVQLSKACWQNVYIHGFELPSFHVMLEATIIAFMFSGLWDMWFKEVECRSD